MKITTLSTLYGVFYLSWIGSVDSFVPLLAATTRQTMRPTERHVHSSRNDVPQVDRRNAILNAFGSILPFGISSILLNWKSAAYASEFTPGGTLVDRDVGVLVGNRQASPSRAVDNSNVVFDRDFYFKFGTAAPWIAPDTTEFPKTMPFTPSKQRYEALKKYGSRVQSAVMLITGDVKQKIDAGEYISILDASAPEYMIRPMGLMANGFLASENTGSTNELFLARWYINEIYLDIGDIRKADSKVQAQQSYSSLVKAINSYYALLNRVITDKVGDKFAYVK